VRRFALFGLVLILGLWCAPVKGAERGIFPAADLSVRVADDRGRPVVDATVRVVAADGLGERRGRTAADGWVDLVRLEPGIYRMEVDRPGYQWLEMEDLRITPGDRLVLRVEIAPTAADEVVILSGGPMVPAAGLTVDRSRERAWLDALPVPDLPPGTRTRVDSRPSSPVPPRRAAAYETATSQGVDLTTAAELEGAAGRAEIGTMLGGAGEPPGSRGAVVGSRRQIDGFVGLARRWDRTRALAVVRGSASDGETTARYRPSTLASAVERSANVQPSEGGFLVAVQRVFAGQHRLEARVRGGRRTEDGSAASLFVAPGIALPLADRADSLIAGDARSTMVGVTSVVSIRAAGERSTLKQRPTAPGSGVIDLSPDGAFSSGVGQGAAVSDGGLDSADAMERNWILSGAVTWQAGASVRATVGGAVDRRSVERTSGGVVREQWRGGGAVDRFVLDPGTARWDREETILHLDLDWRPADAVTVSAGLRARPRTIRGEHGRLAFGLGDSLEPALGVAWDFEGSGRSRAWASWSHRRPGPSESVFRRLGGFWDGRLTVSDGPAAPTAVHVVGDAPPALRERWVLGVEYEVLNHVAVGAAYTGDRLSDQIATFWRPEDAVLTVGPAGAVNHAPLARDTDRVEVWLRKRHSSGWQLELRAAWQDRRGTWAQNGNPGTDPLAGFLDDVLTAATLSSGRLADRRPWAVDLSGAWTFGEGPSVGWWLAYRSGIPRSRLGAESAGLGLDRRVIGQRGAAGTSETLWWFGAAARWRWALSSGELELRTELRNLLGSDAALTVDQRFSTTDGSSGETAALPGWGRALDVVAPPEARVGVVWTW
jgi:hypothetical protein